MSNFFFFKGGPLSNWHASPFISDGQTFHNLEQYMMFRKAVLFQDTNIAESILKTKSPKEAKHLGRKVIKFDEQLWFLNRISIVSEACHLKFSQNPGLKEFLLSTDDALVVEASAFDKIWANGLSMTDPRRFDRSLWPGVNLLGEILTNLRNKYQSTLKS